MRRAAPARSSCRSCGRISKSIYRREGLSSGRTLSVVFPAAGLPAAAWPPQAVLLREKLVIRFVCRLVLLCSLTVCGVAPSTTAAEAPRYEFIDLSDDFVRFWDRTQTLEEGARVVAFKNEFGALAPDFYGAARTADLAPARADQRIAKALQSFPSIREEYTRTAESFEAMLRPAIRSFHAALPDMQTMPPVYLLHSLGEMDGGTRMLGGRIVLMFGADVMVSEHDYEDEAPFLHHELFHVYHQQFFPGCDQVWCALWTEGLAVYAAQQLNPRASDSQLLLTAPEPIRPQVDAHLEEAVCAVRTRLSSNDSSDLRAFFSFGRLSATVPPRAGYYIGYLVAKRAGAAHSVAELAHLSPAEVRPLLRQLLDTLVRLPMTSAQRSLTEFFLSRIGCS
jgi:hypothetical protein